MGISLLVTLIIVLFSVAIGLNVGKAYKEKKEKENKRFVYYDQELNQLFLFRPMEKLPRGRKLVLLGKL